MAHLRAAVIYVVDPSEQCGELFYKSSEINSLKPGLGKIISAVYMLEIYCVFLYRSHLRSAKESL